MKTYYCVITTVCDSGRIIAAVVDHKEADGKPPSHCTENRDCDIYQDWFGSYEEAQAFADEAKSA